MKVINTRNDIVQALRLQRENGKTIGFVPTMGALHQGHISLVKRSKAETDITVVSIFVNPTQFNNPADLKNYPRTLDTDVALLQSVLSDDDFVFAPSVEQMYPNQEFTALYIDFGKLDKVMEGKFRAGHFAGVALVVSKLFDIVMPQKAYFGEKDFQQLAVIKQLVKLLNYKIEIVPCPIVREPDGLAMSSRNTLLTSTQRAIVPLIYQTLREATHFKHKLSVNEVEQWVINQVDTEELLKTEYFQIVDTLELQQIHSWDEANQKIGCIAVHVGNVRLIDNIKF